MNISKEAAAILRTAVQDIREHPHSYDQMEDSIPDLKCGSKGCLFGFIAWRHGLPDSWESVCKLLNWPITHSNWVRESDASIAKTLFCAWPSVWSRQMANAEDPHEKAAVIAAFVELFIATDGMVDGRFVALPSIEDMLERGTNLANALGLKPDRRGLYNTSSGPKTGVGLYCLALEMIAVKL